MPLYPSQQLWPSANLWPSSDANTTRLFAPQGFDGAITRKNPNGELLILVGPGPFMVSNPIDVELAQSFSVTVADGSIKSLTTSAQNYDNVVLLTSGLLEYWPLSEATGTTAYSWVLPANDGTYTGSVTLAQGRPLQGNSELAPQFDGSTGRVTTAAAVFAASSQRTFEGWAYRRTNTTNDALFGGDGSSNMPLLRCDSGGNNIGFWAQDTSSSAYWTGAAPGTNTWFHWALTYDASTKAGILYINGVSKGTASTGLGYSGTPGNFQIGARASYAADPFDGYIAKVAVYNRLLSAAEILAHYNIKARGY